MDLSTATATGGRPSAASTGGRSGVVTLEVPADARYLRVVRLVASACAADAGFDIDDVEDVRVAADELCAGTLELQLTGTIVLTFEASDGTFVMQGTAALASPTSGDGRRGRRVRLAGGDPRGRRRQPLDGRLRATRPPRRWRSGSASTGRGLREPRSWPSRQHRGRKRRAASRTRRCENSARRATSRCGPTSRPATTGSRGTRPRRFRDRGEPFDDLLQVARLGVLKALERFDPDAGSGFPAYAMATAVGELRRHFRDTTWKIHVPRRAKELQTRMRAAIESLSQELGRAPTPAELASTLAVDEDVVLSALDASTANRTSSLDDHDRTGQGSSAVFASGERPLDELVAVARPPRPPPRAGTHDPPDALLQRHEPGGDRPAGGRQPGARVAPAAQHPPRAPSVAHRGLSRSCAYRFVSPLAGLLAQP